MLELRELSRRDVATVNRWRADGELISCLGAPYRYINRETDDSWFDAYLKSRSNTVRCVILDDDEPDAILGLVSLTGINWVHRNCVLHIMIGESQARGKGVGTFAVDAMLHHAFIDLGLHRVELEVMKGNARARHVYEKCGFKVEGVKRSAWYKGGEWVDAVSMGLLSGEWKPQSGGGFVSLTDDSVTRAWDEMRVKYDPPLLGYPNLADYLRKLESRAITYELLEAGSQVGLVSLYANDHNTKIAYITQLAVDPACSGRGLGRMLVEKCHKAALLHGMKVSRLEVRKTNARAISLYERCGYEKTDESDRSWFMECDLAYLRENLDEGEQK